MSDLGLRLDARGLLPLAEARRRVRQAKVFAQGKSHVIPGQLSRPTDADYLWAALLSLGSADEFVREATRLTWKHSPRGDDNIAPHERFGDAILPWLAHFVDEKGTLAMSPSCVLACLATMDSVAALEVLLRIEHHVNIKKVLRAWFDEHGRRATQALTQLAKAGNPRACEVAGVRAPVALTEASILAVLDEAASSSDDDPMPWPPRGASVGHFEPHAMRLVAVRARKGDDWGVLVEVVQGDYVKAPGTAIRWPATIQQYRYGSRVPSGGRYLADSRPLGMRLVLPRGCRREAFAVPASFDGIEVVGPAGTKRLMLTDALVKKLRLEPGRACSPRIEDWPSVIALRARLARDPASFWSDPRALAKKVLRVRDPIVVVATSDFEHVSGPARLPSASKTFRSIATAIVHRDPERFVPGKPNVDWRRQARRPVQRA
jgi:hypothetical protein